ncbi:uncharacterized protein LOC120351507 [Nilaparvata lugens]|uniref:uncharacterized protein LOC120351507 n=1 Tax=Nilaparvata lugens TaxID=108931 RepID=UPI00193D37AA|nr:uncharacterized protein LOC120351507 [Nilaparvata lugens]XP_039285161.1 uncharacterized protein LOC120351507 [Nilaparvata lugens]
MASSSANNSGPSNASKGNAAIECFSPELFVETSMNFSSLPKEIKEELFTSECNAEDDTTNDAQVNSVRESGEHFMSNEITTENSTLDNSSISTSNEIDCPIPSKKPRMKRVAVRQSNRDRREKGEFFTTYQDIVKDRDKFRDYLGMEFETFEFILDKLKPHLTKQYTNWSVKPIAAEERLVLFLRYLTVGMSFSSLASSFKLGCSTVNKVILETAEAVWTELQPLYMPVPSALGFKHVADEFESTTGFPHVLGIIDGRHVRVKCPDNPESLAEKSNYSVVLHIIAGANCRILLTDVGCFGKHGWEWSFTESPLYRQIKYLKIPAPTVLSNSDNVKAPYEFLGAENYPLLNFVLRPYSKRDYTKDPWKSEFNNQFEKTFQICDRTFDIMFSHWKFMWNSVTSNLTSIATIMKSTCVLHNLLLAREPDYMNVQKETVKKMSFRLRKPGLSNLTARERRHIFGRYFADSLHISIPATTEPVEEQQEH